MDGAIAPTPCTWCGATTATATRPHPGAVDDGGSGIPPLPTAPAGPAATAGPTPAPLDTWLVDSITPDTWNPRTGIWNLDTGLG